MVQVRVDESLDLARPDLDDRRGLATDLRVKKGRQIINRQIRACSRGFSRGNHALIVEMEAQKYAA